MESLEENDTGTRNTEENLIHGELSENENHASENKETPSRSIHISVFFFFLLFFFLLLGLLYEDKIVTYSLFQKKRTFNSEFFCGPPGGGGPKIHMVDYVLGGSTHAQLFSLKNLQPF